MGRPRKYPPELLDRSARVVIDSGRPIAHAARDLGLPAETLRRYVRQLEADERLRPELPTAAGRDEIRRRPSEVSRFLGERRDRFGVEPICRVLGVSASAYYQRATGQRSARVIEDERLLAVHRAAVRGQQPRVAPTPED